MIAIISGSNRKDNLTRYFAEFAYEMICYEPHLDVCFIDLAELDELPVSGDMYGKDSQPEAIRKLQIEKIIPATKFWFFIPEYNGSYPGILKLILDCLSVRDSGASFMSKKACITGIASGRAGNLRGMDHLADVLNHLGTHVHPNKVPISSIYQFFDEDNKVVGDEIVKVLLKQANQLLSF